MKVIGFTADEIQTVYKILATILHLVILDDIKPRPAGSQCSCAGFRFETDQCPRPDCEELLSLLSNAKADLCLFSLLILQNIYNIYQFILSLSGKKVPAKEFCSLKLIVEKTGSYLSLYADVKNTFI